MLADDDPFDVSLLLELTHEAMQARWKLGLVTPMSATISTFAKTDGSWWTATPVTWQRVPDSEQSQRLDYHHDRFESNRQAKGPASSQPFPRA